MTLRVRLSQFHSISSNQLNSHGLLEVAARLIRAGELHIRPSWGGVEFCSYRDAINSQTQRHWRPELGGFEAWVNVVYAVESADSSILPESTSCAEVQAVVEQKRYPLVLVMAYKHPTAEKNKPTTPRCKLENILTGPETRRSGEIKPSDPHYTDLRRREMRPGDYTLEFLNPARQPRPLELKK